MADRIRLCDGDRAEFGGPDELVFDEELLLAMRAKALIALEDEMGLSYQRIKHVEIRSGSAEGIKARAWLARQLSGDKTLRKPSYAEFEIRPLLAVITPVEATTPLSQGDQAEGTSSTPSLRAGRSKPAST